MEEENKKNVIIRFENQGLANNFVEWLKEQGKDDYWNWSMYNGVKSADSFVEGSAKNFIEAIGDSLY